MTTSSFSPPNILVMDDDNISLAKLVELIQSAGYIARPSANVSQSVSAIEALTPDLILIDISLSDIEGFGFCSILKKSARTRDIPIVFISTLNSAQVRIRGYQAGVTDFIEKPYDSEELMLHIKTLLDMYKTRQELEAYNRKLNKIINGQIHKIFEEQKNLIYGLNKLVEKMYSTKSAHMERIGRNSRILALGLHLSPRFQDLISNSFIEAIEIVAPIHDLGKVAISDSILHKSETLGADENNIMMTHTIIGAEVLEELYSQNRNNEYLRIAIEIVKHHHENWDGTGYPAGLKAASIPMSARIVTVVDAYDVLINESGIAPEKSMEIINDGAGIQFDPDIVAVFQKIQNQLVR